MAVLVRPVTEARFPAMGTDAHVVVVGGPDALTARARDRIEALEQRWSRFRPTSELCRLNEEAGRPVLVSPETFDVVSLAIEGWRVTGGRFDPTVLAAMERAGYDRTFDDVRAGAAPGRVAPSGPSPGCDGITLDPVVGAVTLPGGVALDLGGIGKGYAADLVAAQLLDAGADGACVNLGGDLRVAGRPPGPDGWVIEIESEPGAAPPPSRRRLALAAGAVATTSSTRRAWTRDGRRLHHVIDPATGAPVADAPVSATVIADTAWRAEILAKSVMVGGVALAAALLPAAASARVVDRDGVHDVHGFEAFLT